VDDDLKLVTIGPYRVLRRLGSGGMGEVFLAWDPRLEREVAVKRVRPELGLDPQRRARFLREARVAAGLRHPSLVQVFDLLDQGGADHIVMEYVPGATLREALEEGPLPLEKALPVAISIAEGLAYAHGRGVLHRDLKAENILLAPGGLARIADFGIARRLPGEEGDETLTREGAVLGTPRAMAPEQACGDPLDARSDLFSFGVLLYELCAGTSPFLAATKAETVRRVLEHHPPALHEVRPEIPADLSRLIGDLLEKDRELRPRDAEEVAGRLRALRSENGGSTLRTGPALASGLSRPLAGPAGREPPPSTFSIPARRRAWGLPAAAVLAVLAVAGTRLLPWGAAPRDRPLSVAVLEPRLAGGAPTEETEFLAFTLRGALQSALTSLEQIFPKSSAEVDAVHGTPFQVARAVAADEVIETSFACRDRSCTLDVARLRGRDGAMTWSGRIAVPLASPLTAAQGATVLLREAYRERRPRPGIPDVRVLPRDYEEFLAVRRQVTERPAGADLARLLARLAAVRARSPEFVEPYLLAATLQVQRFFARERDPATLSQALALLTEAQTLAPGNPEVYASRAFAEIQAGRLSDAEATLAGFERRSPGDPRVLDFRALLADRRGRPEEALDLYRQAADRQPSAARLRQYATFAWRQGKTETARRTLASLLARVPDEDASRNLLADVELTSGDPRRAAALYRELAAKSPGQEILVNLGLARMLLGDYDGAAESIGSALERVPDNYFYLLNLAQVRWLQGRRAEAGAMFRRVLALSGRDPARDDWQRLTVRAQALAHLGQSRQAVEQAQEALRLAPQSGQAAFEASLVYALVGDRTAAEVSAQRARDLGFTGPAWFRLPWFAPPAGQ
jgi:tetratricopeptide (TPR) repeat protein